MAPQQPAAAAAGKDPKDTKPLPLADEEDWADFPVDGTQPTCFPTSYKATRLIHPRYRLDPRDQDLRGGLGEGLG